MSLGEKKTVTFDIRHPCFPTPILVTPGQRFKLTVSANAKGETDAKCAADAERQWCDASIPAGSGGVAREDETWGMRLLRFLKRHPTGYLQPMVAVAPGEGSAWSDAVAVPTASAAPSDMLEAKRRGRLFLYVNDAVCAVCTREFVDIFYRNNQGAADVTIVRME